jgi:hypothetical protein
VQYFSIGQLLAKAGGFLSGMRMIALVVLSPLLYHVFYQDVAVSIRRSGNQVTQQRARNIQRSDSSNILSTILSDDTKAQKPRHMVSNQQLIENFKHRLSWNQLYFLIKQVEELE